MPGSRERCDICLIGAGRDKQAGGPAPRPLLSSSFASGLRRCIQIAAIFAALSLSPAATAGGAAPLASYLRQDGTQLDLRGADVVDEDLAVLDESVFSRVASAVLYAALLFPRMASCWPPTRRAVACGLSPPEHGFAIS